MSQNKNTKWNDNRTTDAFKSTRKNRGTGTRNENSSNIRPVNTRIWKGKSRSSDKEEPTSFNNRQWEREPSSTDRECPFKSNKNNIIAPTPINNRRWERESSTDRECPFKSNKNNIIAPTPINSKWTAKRPKRDDEDDNSKRDIFANSVPEKKSFNKKIVIIERKTRAQIEAEKKAVYESFIKESYILKVEDHLGNKKKVLQQETNDCWNSDNEDCKYDKEEHLTEFEKWERDFLNEVDGEDGDDFEIANKRRKAYFSGLLAPLYKYYKLDTDTSETISETTSEKSRKELSKMYKQHKKNRLMYGLMGLSVLPSIMVEDTQENVNEAYESLYEFMISKRMDIGDISFEYNVEKLYNINNKLLRKEFNKLRKKYNSIRKIKTKLDNKEKVQKGEQVKYASRHECIFLYHRLRYYDEYYMDGELNFTNNVN